MQAVSLLPQHGRMRAFGRDLIRGGHYGQRSYEPHLKAEHMAHRPMPVEPAVAKWPHVVIFAKTEVANTLAFHSNGCTKEQSEEDLAMKPWSTIIALLASASTALAADLPRRVEPMAPAMVAAPAFNWSGLYLGAHVGGTFAADNVFGENDARLMAGVQIGWDWQFAPTWVLGIEANYSFVDSNDGGVFAPVTLGPSPDALVTHGAPRCCTRRVVMLGPILVAPLASSEIATVQAALPSAAVSSGCSLRTGQRNRVPVLRLW